ncbi:MAG: YncE family protein [Pseudohongiellaceae bacterium]
MRLIAFVFTVLFSGLTLAEIPSGLTGTLLVLNKGGNDASFINLATGDIVATASTGEGPHEVVVSSDGLWAVGTDYDGGDSLTVFDIKGASVARTIDLSGYPRPHGIDFLPGQQEVVVTSESAGELVVVNIHDGNVLGSIATNGRGSHMLALGGKGDVAYTSNMSSNNVTVINLSRGRMQAAFKVPARPEAITVNDSGSEVWVGSNDEGLVSVLNSATGKTIAQLDGFDWPYRILLSKDERVAVIPDMNNNDLKFIDAQSKQELGKIEFPASNPQGIIFHPNDKIVFLALAAKNKVAVIDVDTRKILGEYSTGQSPDGLGYSPLVLP